ncbi:CHAT domain-containing tetratricopeptide repeat protein [Draconibacterium sp. IB214405]|uniref:CHAT domain-containing protein n=1 Tax=Draconibacterium sp. IB214405 TaxID=3097352 RepID=UPI002A10CAB7|nr:CHAT domain-containing tetratricopeptide repeat protein [Draconibacterium sp. IB214405]MDX8339903.1 CHAT domain-containing tetratricopeptide repeat protein [Draconibacterium sp. IB214405]
MQDSIALLQKSNELRRTGANLSGDGKHDEALEVFKEYLDYRKKIYGNENYYLGTAYYSIGISYKNLGENEKALENYLLAEKNIFLRRPLNNGLLGVLYLNIGNVYRAKLDYINSLNYFNQALNSYMSIIPINYENVAKSYYAISEIKYITNNYREVIEISNKCYSYADTAYQISFDNILAGSYLSLGDNEKANNYYIHAISLSNQYYGTSLELANAFMDYAQFLAQTNHFDQAIENLSSAYELLKTLQNETGTELATYYQYEGDIYRDRTINTQAITSFKTEKKRNLLIAIESYKNGLAALEMEQTDPETSELHMNQTRSLMDCISLIKAIGDVYLDIALLDNENRGSEFSTNLDYALSCYNNTGELILQARKEISNDESKIQLTNLQYQTISKIIESSYLAYDHSGNQDYLNLAFHSSEQLKSSALFDKISNELAQENSLIPDSIIELERKLNNTISNYSELQYEELSYEEPDSSLLDEYNSKIFNASRQRDELNRYMEENYPDYYDLKYSNSFLDLTDIQKQTDKKEALIEYVLIEPDKQDPTNETNLDTLASLFTFFITDKEVHFNKTRLQNDEIQALETTFRFMSSPDYIFTHNEDAKQYCLSAHKLYKLLIEPYEKYLTDKHLTIIPDGKLNYLSFDGLLRSLPDTSETIRFNELDYLIKNININYANSVNIFLKNKASKPKLQNHTLAFAPKYNSEDFVMTGSHYSLAPLPGVEKEVNAISKSVNTTVFKSDNATEQNFREESGRFDILHLAMHAYINDSLPAYSRLAFSQNIDSTALDNDGWLNTADIYNLKLNAKMTVLSACNTGIGKLQKGEGLMSLARGFLYAGCPSVVMSLWEVEDEAGTQIMTSFYKYLKGGKTKDEALRLAKLHYLENSNSRLAHPHYWMSFKSIGDNSPVYTSYDLYFFAILIFLIIAFSIDQGIRIKKARRNRQA